MAGRRYTFDAIGNTLQDPTLTLRDAFGRRPNSHIDLTAPFTSTFHLDVGGFGGHMGSYVLIA